MPEILGFVLLGASAASVDCHLLDSCCLLRAGAVAAANRSVLAWDERKH